MTTAHPRARRRFLPFTGSLGLSAAALAAGLTAGVTSSTAEAIRSPGIIRGIVCAVPINLCLRVVTHATVNGATVVRDRPLIPALGVLSALPGQPIDVTGDGRDDLLVTLAVPITLLPPGYNANKPTLKVVKLASAPASLPVKVEVVADATGGGKLTFGYDARTSTAPSSFVAAIDLTNRDLLPGTDQALVNLSITPGNSTAVALVTETFDAGTGFAEADRGNRDVTQVGFRAVPALNTVVPGGATLDFTDGDGSQHLVLTRTQPTTAEVLLDAPGHDPRLTARIDRLPSRVELTLVNEDTDHDADDDLLSIDYSGSEVVHEAKLTYESLTRDPAGDHRPVLGFTARDLPKVAHLEYDSLASAIALDASARTAGIDITGEDTVPFFKRARSFGLSLDDLPVSLDASFKDGHVVFHAWKDAQRQAHDALGALSFRAQDVGANPIPVPDCGAPTCDDGYDAIRDVTKNGAVSEDIPGGHYLLAARLHKLRKVDLSTSPRTDILVDTAPDLGPPGSACGEFPPPGCTAQTEGYRPFEALIKDERVDDDPATPLVKTLRAKLGALLPDTHFIQGHDDRQTPDDETDDIDYIEYDNAAPAGSVVNVAVDGTNQPGPRGKNGAEANLLSVKLDGVPRGVKFSYGNGGFPMKLRNTSGSGIQRIDVRLTSAGATTADLLPSFETVDYNFTPGNTSDDTPRALNGVRLRDFADRNAIHARVDWLRTLDVDKDSRGGDDTPCQSGDKLCIRAAISNTGQHPRMRFDGETGIRYDFSDATFLPGVERTFATLDQIPLTLTLRQFEGASEEQRLQYSASGAVGVLGESSRKGFELALTKRYQTTVPDGFRPDSDQEVSFAPMPASVDLCRSGDTPVCSEGVFARTDADTGSLKLASSPRARFRYFDQPNVQAQVFTIADITADLFRFQADASGAGYLAFDTGWPTSSSTPTEASRIGKTVIKQVQGTRNITDFTFGNRFAASRRVIAWDGEKTLFLADSSDITSLLTRTGRKDCTPETSLVLHRVEPNTGIDLTLDLTNELCE